MNVRRARLYDALALLTAIVIVVLDQWTKTLVVEHLSPPDVGPPVQLIGDYLTLFYIRNSGAAFGLFANTIALALLIVVAIAIISYLYLRMLNSGPLRYKLIFGMIIGGAIGNLIDRAHHSGYVVDFIWFRIPQIGFHFAVFNIADASISVGVFLLFVSVLLGGLHHPKEIVDSESASKRNEGSSKQEITPSAQNSRTLHSTERDV